MPSDLIAGDTNSKVRTTLKRISSGAPYDISGGTATLKYRLNGGDLQTKTMTITNGPGGVCEYLFLAGELQAGVMVGEVEVVVGGLTLHSQQTFVLYVRAPL